MNGNLPSDETPTIEAPTPETPTPQAAVATDATHPDAAAQHAAAHVDPAHLDPVTGLLNRHGLASAYQVHAETGAGVVAMHVDLEGFQTVNHMHGHEQGDAVLLTLGQRLTKLLPPGAAIARINGHEFAIIAEGDNPHGQYISRRVEEVCDEPVPMQNGGRASVGARLGWIAATAAPGVDLLRGATFALHEAKMSGVRRSQYDQSMAAEIAKREQTQIELRSAITQNEFELYAQSIVDVFEGRVKTIDLMLRWNHPTRGLLSANEFLPIAEECDFIDDIDRWVVNQLCNYAALTHPTLHFSVNLSMQSIAKPTSLQYMLDKLGASGVPTGRLHVDLGESSRPVDLEAVIGSTRQLIDNGVGVAIDRFGHGYGSLATMMQMSVTAIKLDRSLTALVDTPGGRGVTNAIIGFARQRGLEVIGGGVETASQAEALRDLGCRFQQGYFHHRPESLSSVLAGLGQPLDEAALRAPEATPEPVGV